MKRSSLWGVEEKMESQRKKGEIRVRMRGVRRGVWSKLNEAGWEGVSDTLWE